MVVGHTRIPSEGAWPAGRPDAGNAFAHDSYGVETPVRISPGLPAAPVIRERPISGRVAAAAAAALRRRGSAVSVPQYPAGALGTPYLLAPRHTAVQCTPACTVTRPPPCTPML